MEPPAVVRVLLVDDHQVFRQALEGLLDREPDIEIVGGAGTVRDAVAAAREHAPDVVLMDYELPDGNGADATAQIRADRPETKVVILTAADDEAVLISAIEAGCSGYVTKQKAVEEVVSAVRAASQGEALISPSVLARLLPKLRRQARRSTSDLTPRELETLGLLAEGLSNAAIAQRLVISPHTVRNHVQSVLEKLHAHSKLEAVSIAVREGLVHFP